MAIDDDMTLDDKMTAEFARFGRRTRLLDARGTLVGYFEPPISESSTPTQANRPSFDPVELERARMAEGPWRTTAEVLERLRSLADDR